MHAQGLVLFLGTYTIIDCLRMIIKENEIVPVPG